MALHPSSTRHPWQVFGGRGGGGLSRALTCGYMNRCGLCRHSLLQHPKANPETHRSGQTGATGAPWAGGCTFPVRKCCNKAAQASCKLLFPCHRGRRTAEATSRSGWFYTQELFPSTPNFSVFPVGAGAAAGAHGSALPLARMGRVQPALPSGPLFGSESQRGSAWSCGRCFGNTAGAPGWSSRANTSRSKELAWQTRGSPGLGGEILWWRETSTAACSSRRGVQDQAQVAVAEMQLVQQGLDVRWQQRAAAKEVRHR